MTEMELVPTWDQDPGLVTFGYSDAPVLNSGIASHYRIQGLDGSPMLQGAVNDFKDAMSLDIKQQAMVSGDSFCITSLTFYSSADAMSVIRRKLEDGSLRHAAQRRLIA